MWMTVRLLALYLLATVGACRRASDSEHRKVDSRHLEAERVTHTVVAPPPPCTGCALDLPTVREEDLPLLVVMHGDRETARAAAARWQSAVHEGWAVLSLQCPRDRGCDDSWYKWGGAPSWVTEQVTKVTRTLRIDARRIYLAGWSGGATYIGMFATAWDPMFAAVVLHVGGQPPRSGGCPARPLPAYFLVGDANPAHGAAKALRAYFEACDQEVIWDLVPDADHEHEAAALDPGKVSAILAWLGERGRASAVASRSWRER
jgi:poly(3-hydroxybutyrate) depolymerase